MREAYPFLRDHPRGHRRRLAGDPPVLRPHRRGAAHLRLSRGPVIRRHAARSGWSQPPGHHRRRRRGCSAREDGPEPAGSRRARGDRELHGRPRARRAGVGRALGRYVSTGRAPTATAASSSTRWSRPTPRPCGSGSRSASRSSAPCPRRSTTPSTGWSGCTSCTSAGRPRPGRGPGRRGCRSPARAAVPGRPSGRNRAGERGENPPERRRAAARPRPPSAPPCARRPAATGRGRRRRPRPRRRR